MRSGNGSSSLFSPPRRSVRGWGRASSTGLAPAIGGAPSGTEGLQIFEARKFGLVITDLGMPGISGLQVAERVKKQDPGVPVILISGWAVREEEQRSRDAGVA